MKQLLFTLLLVPTAFASFIGDFAPVKIGSVWIYSYFHDYS
jgi:hypothetical protein